MTTSYEPFEITPDFIEEIFSRHIKPMVFGGVEPSDKPKLALLGGQPGAGKSTLLRRVVAEDSEVTFAQLSGDEFRVFHPQYRHLVLNEPTSMPTVTDPLATLLGWRCCRHAKDYGYPLLIESLLQPSITPATTEEFAGAGFYVETFVVVTHPAVSVLSAEDRYLSAHERYMARSTPLDLR